MNNAKTNSNQHPPAPFPAQSYSMYPINMSFNPMYQTSHQQNFYTHLPPPIPPSHFNQPPPHMFPPPPQQQQQHQPPQPYAINQNVAYRANFPFNPMAQQHQHYFNVNQQYNTNSYPNSNNYSNNNGRAPQSTPPLPPSLRQLKSDSTRDTKRSRSRSKSRSYYKSRISRSRSRSSSRGRNSRRRRNSHSRSRTRSRSGSKRRDVRYNSSNRDYKGRDRSRSDRYRGDSSRNSNRSANNHSNRRDYWRSRSRSPKSHNQSKYDEKRNGSVKGSDDEKNEKQIEDNDDLKTSFVQTTLIPIYYTKDEHNLKKVNASTKLVELCTKFEADILARSKLVREKENLSPDLTKIPDYRQLLLTKKFDKYTRCTCDQSGHQHGSELITKKTKGCKQHKKRSSISSSGSSSSSSSENSRSSSSDSFSSRSSSNSSIRSGASKKNQVDNVTEQDEDFEDIRSMELHRKQNHPERLHPDLSFNEPDQTNEGPLCKCKLKNTSFGTRHQIYYGEEAIKSCDLNSNNADKLCHYRINISPFSNFKAKIPTKIEYDHHEYIFEGYSIFSHEPLENIPDCVVVIYNHEYKLNIVKEDMIENFTLKELDILKQFIFVEILELYDLKWKGYNVDADSCDRFHVMPRFCRKLPYNVKELLSPCEILKYFQSFNVPIINSSTLNKCHLMSNREWLNFVEPLQGSIVTCPGRRPASLRLDQLDRDLIMSKYEAASSKSQFKNEQYPLIIHFNMFRNTWIPMIKNNIKLKKLYHKYFKMRHLLNNKTKLTTEDKVKLRVLGDELQNLIGKSTEVHKETMIEISSANFKRTGIRTDMVQQAVLVPTFVEHLRFHLSLKFLEKKIGYTFKNRSLLQFALTHPSGAFLLHQNLGSNSDHIRNVLFNCKVRNPNYGSLTPNKRKTLLRKKGIHMLFSIMSQKANDNEEVSCISNYERLEFLGDKILELLISKHLFFLFPMYDEGQLSEYRNAIVQNQYLAVLARKLDLHYFILFYHGVDLCSNSALNHALANSFEALLAAIFLDSDLSTVSSMLSKTLWLEENTPTTDLYTTWTNLPLHPIQAQLPKGDRHLIPSTKILQHVKIFEDMIGLEFKHIRLLAQAFCTRSASFNLITLGDNQRLEFLGDTVLNFVVSDYLYRFFPNHHEGHLSLLRSSLVCNSTQALLYDELGMSDFVLTSYINNRKEANGNLKRKADVFEAFVGALYIDQGLEAVSVFCNVVIFNKLQDIILYQFWNDPKSRLQQVCLSIRDVDDSKPSLPIYKLIEEKGPPNHKQYRVAVYFNRKRMGEGIGKSIHDAEVEAAKNALKTKADMFPILNKYVANELKNSKYCPKNFPHDQNGAVKNRSNKNSHLKKSPESSVRDQVKDY